MISRDPSTYAWWLASRSAGIVAFVLLSSAVFLGLFNASPYSRRRPGMKRNLVKIHEQIALSALVAIAAHGIFLLGDPWLKPGIFGISVPLTISYRPIFVALGILGGYLAALLGLTFYARRRIGARRWRRLHQFTVVAYLLVVVHAFGSGTDGTAMWFRAMVVASAVPIATMLALRYWPRPKRTVPIPARPAPAIAPVTRLPAPSVREPV